MVREETIWAKAWEMGGVLGQEERIGAAGRGTEGREISLEAVLSGFQ